MEQNWLHPAPPEIPRLLLMRWDGIEFWERNLCERDRGSLNDVRQAIDDLKYVVDGYRYSVSISTTAAEKAARFDACMTAFDHVSKVSRRVGNDLRTISGGKTQSQLWRGRHIAHLLDGIEDESTAASTAAGESGARFKATKEGHPALRLFKEGGWVLGHSQ